MARRPGREIKDGMHKLLQYTVQVRNGYVVRIWDGDKRVYPYRRTGYFNNYIRDMPRFTALQTGIYRGNWRIK